MIFLNEKVTSLLFSALAFMVATLSGIRTGLAGEVILTRSIMMGIAGLFVGYIFGLVIKALFIEVIQEKMEKEKAEKREKQKKANEENEKEEASEENNANGKK